MPGSLSRVLNRFLLICLPKPMTTQSKSLRLADQLTVSPYAWPGGYPMFAFTNDGAALCHRCTATERESIGTTNGFDGWTVTELVINWEEPDLFCDHCGSRIESAYGGETE